MQADFVRQWHPAAPWVAPFVYFILCLALLPKLGLPPRAELSFWLFSGLACVWFFSRRILTFRVSRPWFSLFLGVAVFAIWIAPDTLWPGWRSFWLFSNPLFGEASASLARAVVLVPLVEELFWRGWLMRWIENPRFEQVPLGSWNPRAFWITAALFALEHGSYWEVGLAAGIAYNAWMVRTRNLGDLILAHAATNACLCAWVLYTGRFEYWM